MHISFEFIVTCFIVVVSPGTGALYTISTGLSQGVRTSFIAALGCTLGIIPHMLAAITGLAALLHSSPLAFEVIKYLGVVWLLYLAGLTLKQKGYLRLQSTEPSQGAFSIIGHAILINLLNPKLSLFFLAFLPQFIQPNTSSPIKQMFTMSGLFMLMTLIVFMFYGAFAAFMRQRVLSRPAVLIWLHRCFAFGFVALSIKLLFAQQ